MQILNYKVKPIQTLITDIQNKKYDPAQQARLILDYMDAITEGDIKVIDPTNPFTTLLSAAATLSATAMLENNRVTRRTYPTLARNFEELYCHMADPDYKDLFAIPSTAEFIVMVQYESLINHLIKVPNKHYSQVIMPRGTTIKVGTYLFLLENSVAIRQYNNGIIEVTYEETELLDKASRPVANNILKTYLQKEPSGVRWIQFRLPLRQLSLVTNYIPISSSENFIKYLDRDSEFYDIKIYVESNTGTKELITTYTEQIYDPLKPTVVVSVLEDSVKLFIPPVYIQSGQLDGQLRVDIYETKGNVIDSLETYSPLEYSYQSSTILVSDTLLPYIHPLAEVNIHFYSKDVMSGGKSALTFAQAKEMVIEHTVGPTITPVTNVELRTRLGRMGYILILNTDIVTNRIYLATRRLPTPIDRVIYTPATLSMEKIHINTKELNILNNVYNNGFGRYVLNPDIIYKHDNGKTTIVPSSVLRDIKSKHPAILANYVNNNDLMYSPFHYILDETEEIFSSRPYLMTNPSLENLNFVGQNTSLGMTINTQNYLIDYKPEGYQFTFITLSGDPYKELTDSQANLQIRIPDAETGVYSYYKAELVGYTEDGERIFTVLIPTKFDITNKHLLVINQARTIGNSLLDQSLVNLVESIELFYCTNRYDGFYVRSDYDNQINHNLTNEQDVVITKEKLQVTFGYYLKHLWTRARSTPVSYKPKLHTTDKLKRRTTWEFERDPSTGAIFSFTENCGDVKFNMISRKGALIYNNGLPSYEYRKGDIVKDKNGNPIMENINEAERTIDILTVEGCYYFTNSIDSVDYRKDIDLYLKTWLLKDMPEVANILLEKTEIYFHPRHTLHSVPVYLDSGKTAYISSTQQFKVTLHVPDRVFKNEIIKDDLTKLTTLTFSNWIEENRSLSISKLTELLVNTYGDSVANVTVSGLGGAHNYPYVSLADLHDQLALRKKMVVRNDNTLLITEDIDINFINISVLN